MDLFLNGKSSSGYSVVNNEDMTTSMIERSHYAAQASFFQGHNHNTFSIHLAVPRR